jgi:uncharacterized membrane protein YdjX (TVP38/TMEM64 family)
MVKVNCASIPKELFESEFFGHVKGAFTGAHRDRVGRFQLADGGTIFLDEVSEIPLELQAKLLRVLQESEFERVGDDVTRSVDVRVIAATNRDLERRIVEGHFREDLFYRLSVFPIEVPPLRGDDVIQLAQEFLNKTCKDFGREPMTLTRGQANKLRAYDWPGNVRELKNVIERAVILSRGARSVIERFRGGIRYARRSRVSDGAGNARASEEEHRRRPETGGLAGVRCGWGGRPAGDQADDSRRSYPDTRYQEAGQGESRVTRATVNRLLVVAGIAGFAVLFRILPVNEWLEQLGRLNEQYPVAVPVAYVVAVTIATVALFPGWISMMLGGLLFGVLPGLPFALLGITAGAYGAFLAGRALGRSWVEKRMGDSLKLQALDEAVNAQSFYIVFLTRFAIVLPFNVLNYAFGLTRVKSMTYVTATALGMLPAVLLYVYLGTLADDFGAILAGDVRPASGAYWIAAIAIVAIVAVIWIVQRAAKRALRQKNSIS